MPKDQGRDSNLLQEVGRLRSRVRDLELVLRQKDQSVITPQDHYQSLYMLCPLPYQSLGPEGHILEVNEEWLRVLGYKRHEVMGGWFGDFMPASDRPMFRERFARFKASGKIECVLVTLVRKDGRPISAEFSGIASYDASGLFLHTKCIFQDVTARIESERALAESEAKFRTLFAKAPDAIILIDCEDTRILEANAKASEMLGYSHDELLHLQVSDIEVLESLAEVRAHVEKVFLEGSDVFVTRHRTKGGDFLDVQVHSARVTFEGRSVLIALCRDMTEARQAEETIKQHLDELSRWQNLTLGRESRIRELKQEVNELLVRAGQSPRYRWDATTDDTDRNLES